MLGELTWEEESDGGLDLSGGESVLLVVSHKLAGLRGDLLEDVVEEGVHDAHGSLGDASLWVHLLEDSVDVDGEGLGSSSLGGSLSGGLWCSSGGGSLSGFLCHCNLFNFMLIIIASSLPFIVRPNSEIQIISKSEI